MEALKPFTMELDIATVHESVLSAVLSRLDVRSRCSVMCTCTFLYRLLEREDFWSALKFEDAGEQEGMNASALFNVLKRSHGKCSTIQLARSEEARQAERQQRFSNGYKYDQVLPHTKGLRAISLAAMCPALQRLSIDERASCVGGMTNDLAKALAVHCRQLTVLEVYFQRYSLPSELFNDEGLIALSEGCKNLQQLTLHNCDRISDRSMYAVAANCPGLTALTLGGYNEHVTDGGMTVLFEACKGLLRVRLSSKLLKVTDASGISLATNCPGLTNAKLTKAMTDTTIKQLAMSCKQLQELDLHRCCGVSCTALQQLLEGCPLLLKLVLPQQVEVETMVEQMPRCSLNMVEEQQLQVLALQH